MYRTVKREEVATALSHLRDLFRQAHPRDERAKLAQERREILVKNLLSNLRRTGDHPTVNSVMEIANAFALTLDGAHELFGYRLDRIRHYDALLNGGRTRAIESYPFNRDFAVEIPAQLASAAATLRDVPVADLVMRWRAEVPIRAIGDEGWQQPGNFYIQVGTEDGVGGALPPGVTALVEPVSEAERGRPNPRSIYYLQFGDGYRCSRCIVTGRKLMLLVAAPHYRGPQEFVYPGAVRIVGRIRLFATELPLPDFQPARRLPHGQRYAPLILPWEHPSMESLFATEHRRFRKTLQERLRSYEVFQSVFFSVLTPRTERRYRHTTNSVPHVHTLMQLTLSNVSRYSDALRALGALPDDRGRFSLQTLLNTRYLDELVPPIESVAAPVPDNVWEEHRQRYGEWPTLLSLRYPHFKALRSNVVRLAHAVELDGLEPPISKGSFLALKSIPDLSTAVIDDDGRGWARPLYAIWKQTQLYCGHIVKDASGYALKHRSAPSTGTLRLADDDMSSLHHVVGAAVPL